MKRVARAFALLFAIALPAQIACAQYPQPQYAQYPTVEQQLAEFRNRIESLERENQELRVATAAPTRSGPVFHSPQLAYADTLTGADADSGGNLPPSEPWSPPGSEPCEKSDGKKSDCGTDGYEIGSDHDMVASWHHGFEVATKERDFRVHVGGRTQLDAGWFDPDPNVEDNINVPYENGVDFRRARLRVDGTMYGFIEWAAEYDFVNAVRIDGVDRAVTAPTDLWVIFNDMPMGNVRVGNQKPAIGFEHLVSSRFLPFMERSYNQDTFYGGAYNGFWPGVSVFDAYGVDQEGGTWNIGAFKPTDNVFAASAHDGDYAVVARTTKLLWYCNEGESLLHIGASGMQQTTVAGRTVFRTRDAIRTGLPPSWPVPASTGQIGGDDMQWLNGEIAAVNGPWTFQAEYLGSYLNDVAPIVSGVIQPAQGDVLYHGGYAQVFYFITGEHETYDKLLGAFTRVTPNENFFVSRDECGNVTGGGRGAWQVGARYNYLDLNDNGFNGGILHNGTLGLNWFLNPNMKFQFDMMATHRDAPLAGDLGDGWVYGWGTRWAMDF
jgi:phosphate-selective porin OprO/OprP